MAFRVMLDTNIVSAMMREPDGRLRSHVAAVGAEAVCISVVTAGELEYGAAKKPSARGLANLAMIMSVLPVAPLEPAVGLVYGRIRAELERRGMPVGPNDTWIAAHALSLNLTLITANVREFSRVTGLAVENWLE